MDGWKIVLAAVLLLALAGAGIGYSVGKSVVVEGLIEASQRDDAKVFEERVDWESLRSNLKEGITAQKKMMGTLGSSIGPSESQIAPVVDTYVQPQNIPALFYYHDLIFKGVKEQDFIESTGFAAPFGFYITLAYPLNAPGGGDMVAAMRQRLKARLVFRLDGLTWKLKEMNVPLFMVPQQATPLSIPAPKTK